MSSDKRENLLMILQEALGYFFNNPNFLSKALTHKSYGNEKNGSVKNNERFEFLGDSVLDMIVSDYTVKNYSDHSEGALSKIRASVVNESCLAELARKINLGKFLLLGKGEDLSGGRDKSSLLANAFEAVAGAVYFDSNMETAFKVFLPLLQDEINKFANTCDFRDFKSDLQEYTQNKLNCIPVYKVVNETGPDHSKIFEVKVVVKKEIWGQGKGRSKKEAEQAAARDALESYNLKSAKKLTHGSS